MSDVCQFLLVYDHRGQRLVEQQAFEDPTNAAVAYAEAEKEHRDEGYLEVVLVGADSIDTIKQTHGHYFAGTLTEAAARYLAGV